MKDFNFFSNFLDAKKASDRRLLTSLALITLLVVIIGVVYIYLEIKTYSLKNDIDSMEKYLKSEDVIKQIQEVQNKKTQIDIMNQYYKVLDIVDSDLANVDIIKSSLLESINKTLPQNVAFSIINFEDNTIAIQGTSTEKTPIAEFYHNLTSMGIFDNVSLNTVKNKDINANIYVFNIQCILKEVTTQ